MMIYSLVILLGYLSQTVQSACTYAGTSQCDPQCDTTQGCTVQFNSQYCCTKCASGFVFQQRYINTAGVGACLSTCDLGNYSLNAICTSCHEWCEQCTGGSFTECSSCDPDAYQLDLTSCYNYPDQSNIDNTTILYDKNPCLVGYYGIYITKKCEPCPTGCKQCNLYLQDQMPNSSGNDYQMNQTCTGDALCSYALKCYKCSSSSYTLVQGFCITTNRCRRYSWFNSTASSFNINFCYCKDNFYLSSIGNCARCHYTCLTCSGPNANQCLSCPYQQTLSGTSCTISATGTNDNLGGFSTVLNTATLSGWTSSETAVTSSGCSLSSYFPSDPSYDVYTSISNFGQPELSYSIASGLGNHYGIRFRATLVFIDEWQNGMSVIFSADSSQVFSYDYSMQEIIGVYACERNFYDHEDVVDFVFPHTADGLDISIETTHEKTPWTIKEVVIQKLLCHSTCTTCTGPTQTDCDTCGTNQTAFDGQCDCDADSGFFNNSGVCNSETCTTGYKNIVQRACTATCQDFPYLYIDGEQCVEHCTGTKFKDQTDFTCVDACYDSNDATPQFQFTPMNGGDRVCYAICPDGYFGDPSTGECVSECPDDGTGITGYFVEGKFCVQWCDTSGTNLAYHPTRTCVSECPTGFYENIFTDADSIDHKVCEEQCSVTFSGEHQYGDNVTGTCVDLCPEGSYADEILNLCVKHCNLTAFEQIYDDGTDIIRTCQLECREDTNDPQLSFYGNPLTGKCVLPANCPTNYYGDPTTTFCEQKCQDTDYYGDNDTHICTQTCTNGFKQRDTQICVATCPEVNDAGNPQFGQAGAFCEEDCTTGTFADAIHNRECVPTCTDGTFGQNEVCVFNCSSSTWGDVNDNNECVSSCTNDGTTNTYGYNKTRMCVQTCPDTLFGIVLSTNSLPVCIFSCEDDKFGDPDTNLCVEDCPPPYFGDQSASGNRTCLEECPDGWFAHNVTNGTSRKCVQDCETGWADDITRICAHIPTQCSAGYYAHATNHKCVLPVDCADADDPSTAYFADPTTQQCVDTCPSYWQYTDQNGAIIEQTYYGDSSTSMCVLVCPDNPDTYGDNHTRVCTDTCSKTCTNSALSQDACSGEDAQVKDPQGLRRCVPECSREPVALYADFSSGTCVTAKNCSAGAYSDNVTNECVFVCNQEAIPKYADQVSGECVQTCELNYYGYKDESDSANISFWCVRYCPLPQHADNETTLCTDDCSADSYGVNYTVNNGSGTINHGVCQKECPAGQYARDEDHLCVTNCGDGNQSALWGNNQTQFCVTSPYDCPDGTYADSFLHNCVNSTDCKADASGNQYVADNITQQCISECPDNNDTYFNWADLDKHLCVRTCPVGFFGQNSSKQCLTQCDEVNSVHEFADWQLHICVKVCSPEPVATFGEITDHTCVEALDCPGQTWAQILVDSDEEHDRRCIEYCPDPFTRNSDTQKYADNITKTCVETCPTHYYGDLQRGYGMCVDVCPNTTDTSEFQFADNFSKTCVTVCPSSQNTWGDVVSLQCVLVCPQTYFAQAQPSYSTTVVRHCVSVCDDNSWGETIKRTCVYSPTECPTINGSHYYAQDTTHLCVKTCPQTEDTWGENTTWACQDDCSTGFKYNDTRVCIDICPAGLDGDDGLFSDDTSSNGMCEKLCVTAGYYRDVQNSRSCQTTCSFSPDQYYADSTTMRCVHSCPVYPEYYYAYYDGTTPECVTDCPSPTMRDPVTRKCVDECPTGAFYDANSESCVERCPVEYEAGANYYGNPVPTIPKCVVATDCPYSYFADDVVGLCVQTCSEDQWKYNKNCITHCPDEYYGNYDTGFCVLPADCPTDHYANNETRTCVPVCNGTFADTTNKVCVNVCPEDYFSDPATRLCSLQCTNNATISLHENIANQTCVSSCEEYLFLDTTNNSCEATCPDNYFADRTTQVCVSVCPSVPPLFGDIHQNKCVEECDDDPLEFKYVPDRQCVQQCPGNYIRDNFTRFCVQYCTNVTYADLDNDYCVANCSPKYSLDDPNICTGECPIPYYRDNTSYKCVLECPTHPETYFKVVTSIDRRCDVDCPTGQYRDLFSFSCVSLCPPSPATYADDNSGNCVTVCPNDSYAYKNDRVCMSPCPSGMFADKITQECVYKCINGTGTYADDTIAIPACVFLCSENTFANPYTLKCQSYCGTSPKTYGFDNGTHRICLETCPHSYYADNSTGKCVQVCESSTLPYADKSSWQCVAECTSPFYQFSFLKIGFDAEGQCLRQCPSGRFALLTNNSCIEKCPDGLFGDIVNNTCYENCTLTNNKFADSTTNMCVQTCPYNGSYDSYGDLYSRTCMEDCPEDKFTVADSHTRLCEPSCTLDTEFINPHTMKCVDQCPDDPFMFADPVSQTCVDDCSLYSKRYGYETDRICVEQCPVDGLYANDETRRCVIAEECPQGFFGLDPERICVSKCPQNQSVSLYGDPYDTHTCVEQFDCPSGFYAEPHSRLCVQNCPQVPQLFAYNPDSTIRMCQPECPGNYYADNFTQRCVLNCSFYETGADTETYADNSTHRCVSECPSYPSYFASNYTYECVSSCPNDPLMFADPTTRKCVQNCPGGDINSFADLQNRVCVRQCPDGTFMENGTRTCVENCTQGFADPLSRYCIEVCPAYTYGYLNDRTCKTGCPEEIPQLYAEDNTTMCQNQCLQIHNTYADDESNRCVQICPIEFDLYSEELTTRRCVDTCSQSPEQFADFSTRSCQDRCPTIPSLYGQNDTNRCVAQCPNDTWADNQTRRCQDICPDSPDTYGDNSTWTCVLVCPTLPTITYSDNTTRTCVPECPVTVAQKGVDEFVSSIDVSSYYTSSNVLDYYADNATRRCVKVCSNGTFAHWDSRSCVETCPEGEYGHNNSRRCFTTCPENQFADHLLNLCVAKCSVDPIYYGNPDTHICVEQCPQVNNSYGNPLTQECVNYFDTYSGCPDYYYSDNVSRLCVPKCPLMNDTYGDNATWKCVSQCPFEGENNSPNDTYSDNSTMMCVNVCPEYPEYYGQEYSRRCVYECLQANSTYSGSFADNSTRLCVEQCPTDPDYFSDNSTRRCVLFCPRNPLTFADNSTRRCVSVCPQDPDIFGDLSTLRCVEKCPEEQATYADNVTRRCVKVCPDDPSMFGQNETNRCVDVCPGGSFADNSSRLCVAVCPEYPDMYGDPWNHVCVQKCPSNPDSYADPTTQTCVLKCPDGYYAQNNTRRCLQQCPHDKINYADNSTNRCVSKCPAENETYGDNSTQRCVYQCPDNPFTFADNITRMCLSICNNVTDGGWAQNQTRVCVEKCPDESYGNNFTRYCQRYCPEGYYGYPVDNVCVDECPQPYFGDSTTEECVLVCPVSHLLFGETTDRTCTSMCPSGTFADSYSQTCVNVCPGLEHDTFAYNENRTCLKQCPFPLYGYPVTPYRCIDVCINPYYENLTDHRCYKCPDECEECNYPELCITCVSDHYLYSGRCLQSCPTFPVITYANPNRVCGTAFQCTAGYFALNTTKSCVTSCPSGYYKNSTTQTCDSCLRGCSYCRNSTACINCNETLAMWDDYKCHLYCSATRRYYTNTGCASTCPDGTYLSLTSCLTCSEICKTCIVQAQNCKSCANGYYLSNSLCVSECPTNTKAVSQNGALVCKSCDIVTCEQKPLTYEVEQFVDNFKYSFRMKFSESVDITKQISNVIKIKQKTTRRLLQEIAYQTVDYTIYDYGNGEYVFQLNNFDTRDDANMEFELEIVDPEAIKSQSGEFPENTRSTVVIETKDFYSEEDYNTSIASYCQAVVIYCVILLVLTFWNNHAIWMPIVDFLQMMFALLFINTIIPPNPTYALAQFKAITLNFLPNFFADSLPKPVFEKKFMSDTIYSVFGDMIFVRTLGHLFWMLIVLVVVMIVMLIIWKKGTDKIKGVKKYCKTFVKETFWKKHLHGFIYLFFLPVVLISLMKMKDLSAGTGVQAFSIFCSFLFWIPMFIGFLYFTYKVIRLLRDNPSTSLMIQKGYEYISSQQIVLDHNQIYKFNIQANQISLADLHQPRINQLLILPYPIETKFGKTQVTMPLIQYLYKFLICVFIVIGFENGTSQLFLILVLAVANLIYFIVTMPYIHSPQKQYNNYLVLHNQVIYLLLVGVMVILKLQQTVFPKATRVLMGDIMCGIIIAGATVNAIYFTFRTYQWYMEYVWRPFTNTEIFKENYTIQYWEYQKQYEEIDLERKKKSGKKDQFLDAIKLTNKRDALEDLLDESGKSRTKKKKGESTEIKLRPSKNQQLKEEISKMFQNFNEDREKSQRSVKSSERLSKQDRKKVREQIFRDKDMVLSKEDYKEMKIQEVHEDEQESSESETEYEYEYIEEQYPEGTPIDQIMKNCKKGEFIMP